MAHWTNVSFEFFHEIFTEDASLLLLYHSAKKVKSDQKLNSRGVLPNRGLFQRLSGFETGHPSAAGPLPAFDFSCFRRARRCFSRLRYGLIWLRFIRFGFSKLKLEHCSSKGVLEKKKKRTPSKREKAELPWTWLSPPTSSTRILLCFLFFSFFLLFLFLFSSSPACYAHTSHLQPDKYCFTFSAIIGLFLKSECTLRVGRSIGGSFTNCTSLALQPLAFRHLSIESGIIIWPTGVNCTLSLRAMPFSAW